MEATLTPPAQHEAQQAGYWPALWRAVVRFLRKATLTADERNLVQSARLLVGTIGTPLLTSENLDALDDKLDDLLDGHAPDGLIEFIGAAMPRVLEGASSPSEDDTRSMMADLLRGSTPDMVNEAAALLAASTRASVAFLKVPQPQQADSAARTLPPEVQLALRAGAKAQLCLIALLAQVLDEQARAEPWLSRALTDRFISGLRHHLRFLATVPNADVPEALAPMNQRLDVPALLRRDAAAQARFDEMARRLIATGASAYPEPQLDD